MSKRNNDMKNKILDFISVHTSEKGYPPSVREICAQVGLSSPSTVHGYLSRMEKEGLIERDSTKTRAIRVKTAGKTEEKVVAFPSSSKQIRNAEVDDKIDRETMGVEEYIEVPVIGTVAAGIPITAYEDVTDVFPLPVRFAKKNGVFMLKVRGDSMINVGIYDGDLVIVAKQDTARNGDIVVAMVEDEATVKTFYKEQNRIRLQPENDYMDPIYARDVSIIGLVIGLFRSM